MTREFAFRRHLRTPLYVTDRVNVLQCSARHRPVTVVLHAMAEKRLLVDLPAMILRAFFISMVPSMPSPFRRLCFGGDASEPKVDRVQPELHLLLVPNRKRRARGVALRNQKKIEFSLKSIYFWFTPGGAARQTKIDLLLVSAH